MSAPDPREGHCSWLLDRGYWRGHGCGAKGIYEHGGRNYCGAHLARVMSGAVLCESPDFAGCVGEHGKRVKKGICQCCGKAV